MGFGQGQGVVRLPEAVGINQANDRGLGERLDVTQHRFRGCGQVGPASQWTDTAEITVIGAPGGAGDQPHLQTQPFQGILGAVVVNQVITWRGAIGKVGPVE